MAIRLEEPKSDHGRVTQGIPSLDSPQRFTLDRRERKREYLRAIVASEEQKREAAVAPDGSRPTTEYEAQRGRELHSTALMRRINQLNPAIRFEVAKANPELMGAYYGSRFICGFEAGISPEFELREYTVEEVPDESSLIAGQYTKTKQVKVCTGTKRGWRTVLLKLMKEGLIGRGGVESLFGTPSHDSYFWQQQIGG